MKCRFIFLSLIALISCINSSAQEFVVGSILPEDPQASAGFSVKGKWTPSFKPIAASLALPQILVFDINDMPGETAMLNFLSGSLVFPETADPRRKAFRRDAIKQLRISAYKRASITIHNWLTLVYNPPNPEDRSLPTMAKIINATPCLIDRERADILQQAGVKENVIWITAAIDAKGKLKSFDDELAPDLQWIRPELESALKQWRFAPAQLAGEKITSTLRLPVVLTVSKYCMKPAATWLSLEQTNNVSDDDLTENPVAIQATPINLFEGKLSEQVLKDIRSLCVNYRNNIPVTLKIGADGTLLSTELELPDFGSVESALQQLLATWRFSPAKRNKHSVSSTIFAALRFTPIKSQEVSLPKLLYSVATRYPEELLIKKDDDRSSQDLSSLGTPVSMGLPPRIRESQSLDNPIVYKPDGTRADGTQRPRPPQAPHRSLRMIGYTTVSFVINENGSVSEPSIIDSNIAILDAPVIAAVLKRKYTPCMKGGVAGTTRMTEKVMYGYGYDVRERPSPIEFSPAPDQSPCDKPAVVKLFAQAVYPVTLQVQKVEGHAVADVHIDEMGNVTEVKIIAAARPEFGLALQAALEMCRFDPAKRGGRAVPSTLRYIEEFLKPASLQQKRSTAPFALHLALNRDKNTVEEKDLDQPLKLIFRREPVFPLSLRGKQTSGQVTLEFVVDHDGSVHSPIIVSATEPEFGYAAIQAVTCWGYLPPMKEGSPASAKVQTTIQFNLSAVPDRAVEINQ